MNEWGVFLVLTSIVGFTLSIIGALKKYVADPINMLDRTLVKTNERLKVVQESDAKQNQVLGVHSEHITNLKIENSDHERRIKNVEDTVYKKNRV